MATKTETVSINECFTWECPKCYAINLIRDDVRKGDKSNCPSCRQSVKINEHYAQCHSGKVTTHESQTID